MKAILAYKNLIFLDQMVVSGGNFVIGILLARAMGMEGYGWFALLWMSVLFFLGLNQALVTRPLLSLAQNQKDQAHYLNGAFSLQLVISFFVFIISFIFFSFFQGFGLPQLSGGAVLVFSALTSLHLWFDFVRKIFILQKKYIHLFLADAIVYIGQIIGISCFYFLGVCNLSFVFSLLLSLHILVSLLFPVFFQFEILSKKAFVQFCRDQYDYVKWLFGQAVLQWFSGNYFILATGAILGVSVLGGIRIVQNIMGFTHVFLIALENLLPVPAAIEFKRNGTKGLTLFLQKSAIKYGAIFGFILLGLSLCAKPLIYYLYGSEWLSFSHLIPLFCLVYLLVFVGFILQTALRTIENTKALFAAYVATCIFSFCFANYFIQQFELIGLIAGLFITQSICIFIYLLNLKPLLWKTLYT